MKKEYIFKPNFETIGQINPVVAIADLEQEQGMYSATPEFVRKHGGKISNAILDKIPQWYLDEAQKKGLYPNIDIRIHRLYPGDFPAYPGWHCDGEFRETYFSQPDLDRINVSRHIVCTVSSHEGGVSNTQFLNQDFKAILEEATEHTLWGQVHKQIMSKKDLKLTDTKDGEVILFDPWTLHRAMPAKIRGWRLFFRMSQWHKPNLGDGGMLTKQEQIYKIFEGSGW